ncbi:Golgin subfamily A member 1 [Gryllus bimaculatus]|nr:Golgin subfamily A member 1 [Gryllus bimaculatus]
MNMFASLKNKIKEETGSDLTNLPILGNQTLKLGSGRFRGKHSRQGSGSSIGSISLESVTDEHPSSPLSLSKQDVSDVKFEEGKVLTAKEIKRLEKREDEWRKILQKKEDDWAKKMERKEEEFKKRLDDQQKEWKRSLELLEKEKNVLEDEKREVVKQKLNLEDALKVAEEYKKKVYQYQEDIDQLEGFQTQEMAKIKHLLLVKEQELAEKDGVLKENSDQVEALKAEVGRLHRYEEELNNVQRVAALLGERALLERRLEEAHLHLADIKSSWSDKIASLETQVGRLCRQAGEEGAERRRAESERDALLERTRALEVLLERAKSAARRQDEQLADARARADALAADLQELQLATGQEIVDLGERIEASNNERTDLLNRLEEAEKRLKEISEEHKVISNSLQSEQTKSSQLDEELRQVQVELRGEQARCIELQKSLSHERQDKDAILLRNAQVSQEVQLAQQAAREQQRDQAELLNRVTSLENQLSEKNKESERWKSLNENLSRRVQELELVEHNKQAAVDLERDLRKNICDLEEQLAEKNKSIKVLQQRLADMKKTLQRELRGPGGSSDSGPPSDMSDGFSNFLGSNSGSASLSSNNVTRSARSPNLQAISTNHLPKGEESDDINFKYLKHVLIKFLTSREYEAQHLTRAVATLLKFTPEEERLLRETLEWKMSWFGTRPSLGIGQTSKTIPPS